METTETTDSLALKSGCYNIERARTGLRKHYFSLN
jgi:hypothetical protein